MFTDAEEVELEVLRFIPNHYLRSARTRLLKYKRVVQQEEREKIYKVADKLNNEIFHMEYYRAKPNMDRIKNRMNELMRELKND